MGDCPFTEHPVVKYVGHYMSPTIVSCPTCGRNENEDFPDKVREVERALQKANRPDLKVAVLNCLVNGPGEAEDADVGLVFGRGKAVIYQHGERLATVDTDQAISKLLEVIERTW